MIIAIDLHNIRDGGGVNYIRNLLENASPELDGFTEIHLIGAPRILAVHPDRPWIVKHRFEILDAGLLKRLRFMRANLVPLLRRIRCDVLYLPGGLMVSRFRPVVAISRNMMPFRPEFWGMYPVFSAERLRLHLLSRLNALTFAASDGMIFLSQTARKVIEGKIGRSLRRVGVIAHGVDHERFRPLAERSFKQSIDGSFRIIYPSRLEPYKHQTEVVAAMELLADDLPGLRLQVCGPVNAAYQQRFEAALAGSPRAAAMIEYLGEVPNAELPALYARNDLLLFASSCENLPNIMIEAMASGIPICSSDRSPMPEVARDACLYFDPGDPSSIARAIREAVGDPDGRRRRALKALEYAADYSWATTARKTFSFIVGTARLHDGK